jgi:Zn-finger in ubiquitin-hydrolases and other protein
MTAAVDPSVPPSGTGCAECDAVGGWWVHLRRCAACGHIGCCDDSLARHATEHWRHSGHPIIRSFEPGDDWFWDYESNDYYEGPALAPSGMPPGGSDGPRPPRTGATQLGSLCSASETADEIVTQRLRRFLAWPASAAIGHERGSVNRGGTRALRGRVPVVRGRASGFSLFNPCAEGPARGPEIELRSPLVPARPFRFVAATEGVGRLRCCAPAGRMAYRLSVHW